MDPAVLEGLLKAIRDAVSGHRRLDDDVALPIFDPVASDSGAHGWCNSIEELAQEFGWSNIVSVARAGKALKGSALTWFESWQPSKGRTWENFRADLTDLYPEKRNLSDKLSKAVGYNSDLADSYCEYAREKVRLLRSTKVLFTESQLIELICGSITDVNVRMASFNSNVNTTSELISLFSSYVKPKKRLLEQNDTDYTTNQSIKRPKLEIRHNNSEVKKCYQCGKTGHLKINCRKNPFQTLESRTFSTNLTQPIDIKKTNAIESAFPGKICTYCKKIGHHETACWYKARADSDKPNTTSEVNFLG